MVKKVFFRSMAVMTGLLLQFNLWAQEVPPVTLNVETAGTLSSLIDESQKYQITDLTLTGNLNGSDIRFIRDMAGSDLSGNATNGKLSVLNLYKSNIVAGGSYYVVYSKYGYLYYTYNNSISNEMFYNCNKLTNIILPNSVTAIAYTSFDGCTGLTSITIPDSVISVMTGAFSSGMGAFYGCTGLVEFIVSEQNQNFASVGGVLFDKNKTSIIRFPQDKSGTYTIPNDVTSIGSGAFSGCTGLTSITIPNSVNEIRYGAFSGCTGLTSITIPNSVTSIAGGAFNYCTELKNVTLEDGTSKLVFESESFPAYSTSSSYYFSIFDKCPIENLYIGRYFTFGGYKRSFYTGTGIFYFSPFTMITIQYDGYSTGSPIKNVTIGSNVGIYMCALAISGLQEIHIKDPNPPYLTSIKTYANAYKTITLTAFTNINSEVNKTFCKLYVPKGSKSAYQSAFEWKDFKNIIEEGDETAIISIENDNSRIKSIANGITIETKETMPVSVFNLRGQKVYQSVINGNTEIPLNKGVYIVNVNNRSEKVIIK